MEIFCDEAGFTGNQLMDEQQKIFVYAAVAISPDEADELVRGMVAKHRLQGRELKGAGLVKRDRGKHAVTDILEHLQGKFKLAVHLKPYVLACKMFEYIFEPTFSECNSIFYGINFHRFVANLLYTFFLAQDMETAHVLSSFSDFIRKGDTAGLDRLFLAHGSSYLESPLQSIRLYAELHKNEIANEIGRTWQSGVGSWLLDVTTTSLFHLLASWGERFETLSVTCDEARPLIGDLPTINTMVGNSHKSSITFQGKKYPMTFSLEHPVVLAKSHDSAGLQLADVVASAAASVWRAMHDGSASQLQYRWEKLLSTELVENCVWPDMEAYGPETAVGFAQSVVLAELVNRSINGQDLCHGIVDLYRAAMKLHPRVVQEESKNKKAPPRRNVHRRR